MLAETPDKGGLGVGGRIKGVDEKTRPRVYSISSP